MRVKHWPWVTEMPYYSTEVTYSDKENFAKKVVALASLRTTYSVVPGGSTSDHDDETLQEIS